MVLVFYLSSHGFGHASRSIELINAVARLRAGVRVVIRTFVSPAFISGSVQTPVDLQAVETDTGVVQVDSLEPDETATAQQAAAFYGDFDRRADAEVAVLRDLRASLVIGDVPPLAFAAAARAGIPSLAIANFTWDWIYEAYPAFDHGAPGVLTTIREAYAATDVALRLPLHGGFETMTRVEDIPIIARHAAAGREKSRQILGIDERTVVALASFGAYGVSLPFTEIVADDSFTLIVTEREAPASRQWDDGSRLLRVSEARLAACGLGYPDLVAAADVVVTKPGYGIVSECIANGAALLYTSRGRFPEYELFVREMPAWLRCRYIPQEDLRAGRWTGAIQALLQQPAPSARVATDGAGIAAERILAEAAP